MTQEEKELLLKDLSTRLPCGVKCLCFGKVCTIDSICISLQTLIVDVCGTENCLNPSIDEIRPYLRPMSSMTEEEKEELVDFGLAYWDMGKHTDEDGNTIIYGGKKFQLLPDIETYDWLNRHHFDYRGLISKDLAVEVTEENNPYKELQEDRELLLKDLCARLPYETMVECSIDSGNTMDVVLQPSHIEEFKDELITIKPYLRPISSMTEEEAREYANCGNVISFSSQKDYLIPNPNLTDWLNEHHFDYRGLIEKGLALKAPDGMYEL